MRTLREYINLVTEDTGLTTTQLTPAQYQAKMDQTNATRQAQGQAALPVTPANQISTPTTAQTSPVSAPAPAPAAPAATPAAKQWQAGVLGTGSSGPEVEALQKRLGIAVDGKFGPATQQAVIALQKKLGVSPDGAYGPLTKAAHDKMPQQSARPVTPPTDTNKAEKGQPAYTTANDTTAKPATDTAEAGKILKGIENGTIDPNSLKGRATMATPKVAPPEYNPSGVGKNAELTPDQAAVRKDILAQPTDASGNTTDATGTIYKRDLEWMKRFGQNAEPAPVQQQAAPVQQQAAPGTTAGGAVTSRPIQPATGARAQMLQRQQAQNQIPESIDPLVQENTGYDEIERIVSLVHYR
jgi:peptidoglycan hydrolase-like protein with peptidoglycan-binding domain